MTLPGLMLAFAGFTTLSLAMKRHAEQVSTPRRMAPWRSRALRAAGWMLLLGSLALVVSQHGRGMGLVIWTGLLTPAALSVVLLLCYRPRTVPFVSTALLLACGAWLLGTWLGG